MAFFGAPIPLLKQSQAKFPSDLGAVSPSISDEELERDEIDRGSPLFIRNVSNVKCTWNPKTWGYYINWDALRKQWPRYLRIVILLMVWVACVVVIVMYDSNKQEQQLVAISANTTRLYYITQRPNNSDLITTIRGNILPKYAPTDDVTPWLTMSIDLVEIRADSIQRVRALRKVAPGDIQQEAKSVTEPWILPLVIAEDVDALDDETMANRLTIDKDIYAAITENTVVRLEFAHTLNVSAAIGLLVDLQPIHSTNGVYCAAAVLIFVYVLIIFEVVHRTLAAMIASTMAVALLSVFGKKPSLPEIMSWIDAETLLLLTSMMLLIQIVSKTGVFDYSAVICYRLTRGKIWPLILTLCLLTGIFTAVMDNVTTVLLTTPVTIKLCEMLKLDPVPVLMAIIMFCNIFGAWTPIGDPPNLIISSNEDVQKAGVDFGVFTLHMGLGVWLAALVVFLLLRFVVYRDPAALRFKYPLEVEELRHELAVWERTASAMSTYTRDEVALRKALTHQANLKRRQMQQRDSVLSGINIQPSVNTASLRSQAEYDSMLKELEDKYPIRNYTLLYKSIAALGFAILFFFMHSIKGFHMSLGWVALMAAILLLILADHEEIEGVLSRIEWTTLLFFAALFVLMEAMTLLGLVDWIGHMTEKLILRVDKQHQLTVAILLILWVSAIASCCIDNIPLTTMMIKIITGMSKNPALGLPLQPLVWALAFGGCFGGNGTLIGSSANVVCTGVAEQHGYKVTFMQFFKVGFPMMLATLVVASVYLLLAHVVFKWHSH